MPPQIDIVPQSPSPAPASRQTSAPASNVPAPTPEEIAAGGKQMVEALFGSEPEAAPVAAEPAAPATAAPPAPVAPTEPTAPNVVPLVAPAPEPMDDEPEPLAATIERTARMTAEAVAERLAPAPAEPASAEPRLTPDDEADLRVLRYMAREDARNAELPEKFLAFVKLAYAYQDEWEAKNPDETFNWEESEHARWYEEKAPKIDRAALNDARADMRAEEKWDKKMQPILARQQAEKAWEEAKPKISQRVNALVVTMADLVDPQLGKLLRGTDGQPDLSAVNVARVEEMDPVACDILNKASHEVVQITAELEKTGVAGMNYQLDPERNPVHAVIARYIRLAEQDILSSPAAEQVFSGKQFTAISEMNRLRRQIQSGTGTPEQKAMKVQDLEATRTTLSIDDLQEIIVDDVAKRAKAKIEYLDGLARKKYRKNGDVQPNPPENRRQPPANERIEPATVRQPLSRPPSLSSASDVLTAGNPASGLHESGGEQIAKVLFK